MTKITLKFNNIGVNKKKFHMSKKAIDWMSVNVNKMVVSNKFNHNEYCFKYFIGYQKGEIVRPLCIILPQMSLYIKYFEYGNPSMSFFIKDEEVGEPVYEYKYLKTKVNEYYGAIKTNFLGNDMLTENINYTSIACITTDSVVKTDEKCFPQVYLEECKYKIKKIQMSTFIIELV